MNISLRLLTLAAASFSLSSCMTMIDKEFTALEARMAPATKPDAIVGMWHNKLKGGVPGIYKGTSHTILFRKDGTLVFRGKNLVTHESTGKWRYLGDGRWWVKLDGFHPDTWYFRTDGTHLLEYVDFIFVRTRLVFVRADDPNAVATEKPW
jgi:hypothetical protein